jgi:hypothetical protein
MFDLTVQDVDGEPRMRDLDIAAALGFDRLRDIRKLITRHMDALSERGQIVSRHVARNYKGTGRPSVSMWLNEKQSLIIAAKSNAPAATHVLLQMVDVFVDWRNDRTVPQPATLLEFSVPPEAKAHLDLVREVRHTKGIAAASWMYDQLPLPSIPDLPSQPEWVRPPINEISPDRAMMVFLRERCVITGSRWDFTRTKVLRSAYCECCRYFGAEPLGMHSFAAALARMSCVYSSPVTGSGFRAVTRSYVGFEGIYLADYI